MLCFFPVLAVHINFFPFFWRPPNLSNIYGLYYFSRPNAHTHIHTIHARSIFILYILLDYAYKLLLSLVHCCIIQPEWLTKLRSASPSAKLLQRCRHQLCCSLRNRSASLDCFVDHLLCLCLVLLCVLSALMSDPGVQFLAARSRKVV